jgi:hypothetical protein
MAEIMDILHGFEICYKTDAHIFRICQTLTAYTCFHCGVTVSTSYGPSAPVVNESFEVEFYLAGVHQSA